MAIEILSDKERYKSGTIKLSVNGKVTDLKRFDNKQMLSHLMVLYRREYEPCIENLDTQIEFIVSFDDFDEPEVSPQIKDWFDKLKPQKPQTNAKDAGRKGTEKTTKTKAGQRK